MVALVVVELTIVRLVMVDVAVFMRMVEAVTVPVAVIFADEIFPDTRIFPCTERSVLGVFVPSPKNPLAFTVRSCALDAVSIWKRFADCELVARKERGIPFVVVASIVTCERPAGLVVPIETLSPRDVRVMRRVMLSLENPPPARMPHALLVYDRNALSVVE